MASLFGAIPVVVLGTISVFMPTEADKDKVHRPEFVQYPYLRIRSKVRRLAMCVKDTC